ncbi:MAG: hypothetical protein K6G11_01245 [Lachnospiraceae bacterium]|nr:hypothetical protein [Lachnospiraceae bacterium]
MTTEQNINDEALDVMLKGNNSSSTITFLLKEYGNGDMNNGLINIYNFVPDEVKKAIREEGIKIGLKEGFLIGKNQGLKEGVLKTRKQDALIGIGVVMIFCSANV